MKSIHGAFACVTRQILLNSTDFVFHGQWLDVFHAAIGLAGLGKVGPKAIGPSRFWFIAGSVPEPNEDTKKLYEAYTYLPHSFALRKWTKEEDQGLQKIVQLAVRVFQNYCL